MDHLTSNHRIVCGWNWKNLMNFSFRSSFVSTKQLDDAVQVNVPLCTNTQLTSSCKRNILGLTFTYFFSPFQLLALYRSLIRPCMEYGSHVWGDSTNTALLKEFKAFHFLNSFPLTDCLDSLITNVMLHLFLFSTVIFMLTALLALLTACLHPSRSLATQGFLLHLISIPSIFLMQVY